MTAPRRRPAALLTATAALALGSIALTTPAQAAATTPAVGAGRAWVRVAHLVPGLGTMDVSLTAFSGHGVADAVRGASYGDVSTYAQVPPGDYAVSVVPSGRPGSTAPVVTGTLQASAGDAYTVAALGTSAHPTVVPLVDDLTPPPAGDARVRVLSAASGAPSVTVTAVGGPVVTANAPFGTGTGYADVPAGHWVLRATPGAGSGARAGSTDVTLAAGSTYTLAVTSTTATGPLTVTPLADASGSARMPVGGAPTGAGGAAAIRTGVPAAVRDGLLGALVGTALAGAVLAGRTRRTGRRGRASARARADAR